MGGEESWENVTLMEQSELKKGILKSKEEKIREGHDRKMIFYTTLHSVLPHSVLPFISLHITVR